MIKLEEFVRFLVKYNALAEFVINLHDHKRLAISQFFINCGGDKDLHIAGAFPWSVSPSGDVFWGRLHNEWVGRKHFTVNENTKVI